jgi:hypothetical protein
LQNVVKGIVYAYTPLLLLACHTLYSEGYDNCIQNGPHDCCGPTKAQGSKTKPANQVSAVRANRVRDRVTQMVASNLHTRDPIEGTRHPQALYLCPGWEVSFMPLRVSWHIAIRIFSMGITRERRLKPPGPNLPGEGGGVICPCLVLWRGTCPCWLSPTHYDLGSTQILTRHFCARSRTISRLTNSGTAPTRLVSAVQSLWVIETPEDEVSVHAAPLSDNPNGTVGLH